jgi:uncharacterized protein (TIGR00297 family)
VPVNGVNIAVGVAASGLVVLLGYRFGALNHTGAAAAFVLGAVTMGLGGLPFAVPLVVFFATSSAWSRWRGKRRDGAASAGSRNASQVLANGGLASAIVIAATMTPPSAQPTTRDWYLIYVAVLAFANADTWATEIGSKLARKARLITNWRPVPAGISGGISLPGSLASLVGAAVVVLSAWLVWPSRSPLFLWRLDLAEGLALVWAGFVASLADSLIGAAAQAQYHCPVCGRQVEDRVHCGSKTEQLRGASWLGNGSVNFIASCLAALAAWYLLRTYAWPI